MALEYYQIAGFISFFKELPGKIFSTISYLFANLFYSIFKAIAQICDWLEAVFKVFCGIYPPGGAEGGISYDPATIVLTNSTIQTIFKSMLILGVVVLLITTFVAVIKTEFNSFAEGNSKTKVLGMTGRAVVNLLVIPVCCILGVMMANVLLRSIHSAINRGSNSTLATQVFVAVSYSANWARQDDDFVKAYNLGYNRLYTLTESNYPGFEYADMIDAAFLNNVSFTIPAGTNLVSTSKPSKLKAILSDEVGVFAPIDNFYTNAKKIGKEITNSKNVSSFSIYNNKMVMAFYNIVDINKFVGIVAIILVGYNMLMMVLGLIKRLFDIGMYYLISPPIIALYPLDKGEGIKAWRLKFITATFSAYGGLVAIDMFLVLLPIILSIDFVSALGFSKFNPLYYLLTGFLKILIVVAGTNFLKSVSIDIMKMIAGKDAGGGALADGDGAMGKVKKTLGKTAKLVFLAVKMFGGIAGGALSAIASIGKVGAKTALKNFANKSVKGVLDMAKGAVNAATGHKFKPGSKNPVTDAMNFFKTGTANKDRQQAIMSLQNRRKNAQEFLKDANAFDKDGKPTNAKGKKIQQDIEKLQKKKDSGKELSKKETQKLTELSKKKDELQKLGESIKEGKDLHDSGKKPESKEERDNLDAYQKSIEAQNLIKRTNKMGGFFSLRSMDRATGSGSNMENASSGSSHATAQMVHKENADLKKGLYSQKPFS